MIVSVIAAMAKNHVIGDGDKIPWHIPEDFKYFKAQTLGKPIIMGRATFESIHAMRGTNPHSGHCLPKRDNIIVTRQSDYHVEGCVVCGSLGDAISAAQTQGTQEIMICGGGQIYKQSLDLGIVDRMYVTIIDRDYDGGVFFPKWDKGDWSLISSDPRDGYVFNVYDRLRP